MPQKITWQKAFLNRFLKLRSRVGSYFLFWLIKRCRCQRGSTWAQLCHRSEDPAQPLEIEVYPCSSCASLQLSLSCHDQMCDSSFTANFGPSPPTPEDLQCISICIYPERFSTACDTRFSPRNSGNMAIFRGLASKWPFPCIAWENHMSQGVESRGSLMSVPLALRVHTYLLFRPCFAHPFFPFFLPVHPTPPGFWGGVWTGSPHRKNMGIFFENSAREKVSNLRNPSAQNQYM